MNAPIDPRITDLLGRAIAEDLGGAGDITTKAVFPQGQHAAAVIKSKEAGVLSGGACIVPLFALLDPALLVVKELEDGALLIPGRIIARLDGPIAPILAGERIILNLLQRLSAIATQTARLVNLISHTKARLFDTRKTVPGLRFLEKQAVVHGGGRNHRFGLFDMVLIKDTHVKAAGGPGRAVAKARQSLGANSSVAIEVEVQSLDEFGLALAEKPDRIMLDNMGVADMARCVALRNAHGPKVELEASGNVTEKTIRAIAEAGVDFISSGSITHSVTALDIHLVII